MKSNYQFLWGNTHPHWIMQVSQNSYLKNQYIIWNYISKNVITVSRHLKQLTYHNKEEIKEAEDLGVVFLDQRYVNNTMKEIHEVYDMCWKNFKRLKKLDVTKLSNKGLIDNLITAINNWILVISYFKMTTGEKSLLKLNNKLMETFDEEEIAILTVPPKLDVINKEIVDWQKLLRKRISITRLIKHADKFPWIVSNHFTMKEVIHTLNQRFLEDKKKLKLRNIKKEKKELIRKQKKILKKKPKLRKLVKMMQDISHSRIYTKSCWAGTDYYIIPILEEISKRVPESFKEMNSYYLLHELKDLLYNHKKLSDEEKKNREKCFVGLLKNKRIVFKSGDEAEELAEKELKELYSIEEKNELKGNIANLGKAKGIARILHANNNEELRELRKSFEKGQILITEMTQPNIMDIASKAGAIVTDEGGLLCHAAIISREMNIPCIVGTEIATSVFKEGDIVEVDAKKGIVKKI